MTRQCQHVNKAGQCENRAIDGEDFCERHCKDPEAKDKRLYILLNHRRRVRMAELADHDDLRTLTDEIAIARMTLEERLNGLKTDADFIVASASLNSHLMVIEKLVTSCHKIEVSLGNLLSKPSLIQLANDLVKVILEELADTPDYEETVDKISQRIIEAVSKIGTKK